jgi:hypothetical protein
MNAFAQESRSARRTESTSRRSISAIGGTQQGCWMKPSRMQAIQPQVSHAFRRPEPRAAVR